MDLSKIVAISAMPGLYEVVSSRGDGLIVSSLEDEKRKFVPARKHQFTNLDNVAIYLKNDETLDMNKVFEKIKELEPPNSSSDEDTKTFFAQVVPDYDEERVHMRDMKRVVQWYSILNKAGRLVPGPEPHKDDSSKNSPE